jgi:hypothetical protein
MPKVLAFLLLLISLNLGAAEPKGFVLKGAFVRSDGSIAIMYFPGEGKVAIFKTEELCNEIRDRVDVALKEKAPDMQYLQLCVPLSKGLVKDGLEKRPQA